MHVLAFVSQKGGSGKTTLSGHIAVEAVKTGYGSVVLIDTDPQGSLTAWWNERKADTPAFAKSDITRLLNDIARLRANGFDLAIIDTPPAMTAAIQNVVAVSDLVVVPTRPSPHDLRAVGATVELVEREGKPLVFVVNAANKRARITADAAVALSQHGTVAPITIHQRTDFAVSMIDGRSVGELNPNSPSKEEINHLWEYLRQRLQRTVRSTAFKASPDRVLYSPPNRAIFGRRNVVAGK